MSNMIFYKGQGAGPSEAICEALINCAPVLEENPTLIIELLDVNHCGTHWEAHIRLIAIEVSDASGFERKSKTSSSSSKTLNPRDPGRDNFHSDDTREGLRNEYINPLGNFDQAAYGGGYIPDIPTQDIELLRSAGWSDLDIRNRMVTDNQDVLSTLHIIDPEPL